MQLEWQHTMKKNVGNEPNYHHLKINTVTV